MDDGTDVRVGRNNTTGIFMNIFLILLTFAVNILLSGYNNQQIYATTVVEKNNIEEQENTLYSGNRITSDYLEVSGGVNFWCENKGLGQKQMHIIGATSPAT